MSLELDMKRHRNWNRLLNERRSTKKKWSIFDIICNPSKYRELNKQIKIAKSWIDYHEELLLHIHLKEVENNGH